MRGFERVGAERWGGREPTSDGRGLIVVSVGFQPSRRSYTFRATVFAMKISTLTKSKVQSFFSFCLIFSFKVEIAVTHLPLGFLSSSSSAFVALLLAPF